MDKCFCVDTMKLFLLYCLLCFIVKHRCISTIVNESNELVYLNVTSFPFISQSPMMLTNSSVSNATPSEPITISSYAEATSDHTTGPSTLSETEAALPETTQSFPLDFNPFGTSGHDNPCFFRNNAVYFGGKCLWLVTSAPPMSWDDAQSFCRLSSGGGRLVEVRSLEEMNAVFSVIKDSEIPAWIGITDRREESVFQAESNGDIITMGGMWDEREPDDRNGSQNCLVVSPGMKIGDEKCQCDFGFICEQNVTDPCVEVLFGAIFFSGSCYLYVPTPLSWYEAQRECTEKNAFLAEPSTPEQILFISKMADKYEGGEWLGGYADETVANFTWFRSGSEVPTFQGNSAENHGWLEWDGLSPVFLVTSFHSDTDSFWTFTDGLRQHAFICQYDAGNPCEAGYPGSIYAKGVCLKLHRTPETWSNAKKKCVQENAILVEFRDRHIADAAILMTVTDPLVEEAFIGLSDSVKEGEFTWTVSGGQLQLDGLWDVGQPKNLTSGQDFVKIDEAGRLEVVTSGTKHAFICMKEFIPPQIIKYVIALPHLQPTSYTTGNTDTNSLQITTGISSHKVYLVVKIRMGLTSSDTIVARSYVTNETAMTVPLSDVVFINRNGVYPYHVTTFASHPVCIVLFYTRDFAAASLLVPAVRPSVSSSPSTYFLFSPTFSNTGNQVTVASASEKETSLLIRIPSALVNPISVNIGGMDMKILGDIKTVIPPRESFFLLHNSNMNGIFLWASRPVLVVLGGLKSRELHIDDYVMSVALPTTLTSKNYVTFPAMNDINGSYTVRDIYVMLAIYDDTVVKLYEAKGAEQGLVTLAREGDVIRFETEVSGFYLFDANRPFYLVKNSYLSKDGREQQCLTYILPQAQWRSQYSFYISPEFNETISIFVVINSSYKERVTLDGTSVEMECENIPESPLSGCYFVMIPNSMLWKDHVHHLGVWNNDLTFGAYIAMASSHGYLCHAMGVVDDSPNLRIPLNTATVYLPVNTLGPPPSHPPGQSITTPTTTSSSETPDDSTATSTTTQSNATTTATLGSSDHNTPIISHITTTSSKDLPPDIIIQKLQSDLGVDFRSTSAFKRTKISMPDKRVSSTAIGATGVIVMCLTFGFFLFSDVISAARKLMEITYGLHGK